MKYFSAKIQNLLIMKEYMPYFASGRKVMCKNFGVMMYYLRTLYKNKGKMTKKPFCAI